MSRPTAGSAEESDPERVLSQALRAMAGGRPTPSSPAGTDNGADDPHRSRSRLTAVQVLLIAAIIGLVIGMGIALVLVALG